MESYITWVPSLEERIEMADKISRCVECGRDFTGTWPVFCPECGGDKFEVIEPEENIKPILGIGTRKTKYTCEFCRKNKCDGTKSSRGFMWCGICEPYDKFPNVTRIEKEVFDK
jgi:hypothetical protein